MFLKKFNVILVFQLLSLNAEANHHSPLQTDSSETYFQQLASWHRSGTPVLWSEATENWSGRCFNVWDQQTPLNAMIFTAEQVENSNLGAGFPARRAIFFSAAHAYDPVSGRPLSANYFDNYNRNSDGLNLKAGLRRKIAEGVIRAAQETSDGLFGTHEKGHSGSRSLYLGLNLRRSGNYLVMETANLLTNATIYALSDPRPHRRVPVGPIGYCYFFQP